MNKLFFLLFYLTPFPSSLTAQIQSNPQVIDPYLDHLPVKYSLDEIATDSISTDSIPPGSMYLKYSLIDTLIPTVLVIINELAEPPELKVIRGYYTNITYKYFDLDLNPISRDIIVFYKQKR